MDYLTVGILPEHLLGGMSIEEIIAAPFNMQPVGSGPYRFERLIVEGGQIKGVLLSANEDFYGSAPFIEQFAFRYFPDGAAALAAFQGGEIGGIGTVSQEILDQVLLEADLQVYTSRLPEWTLVFLNLDNPNTTFFQDVSVRKALLTGLNRQRTIDTLLGGQAFLSDGPIMPGSWVASNPPSARARCSGSETLESCRQSAAAIRPVSSSFRLPPSDMTRLPAGCAHDSTRGSGLLTTIRGGG
jgi:peptide/nickel transport system substrate-binding protein